MNQLHCPTQLHLVQSGIKKPYSPTPLKFSTSFVLITPSKWKKHYKTELIPFPALPFIHEVVEICQDSSIPRFFLHFFLSGCNVMFSAQTTLTTMKIPKEPGNFGTNKQGKLNEQENIAIISSMVCVETIPVDCLFNSLTVSRELILHSLNLFDTAARLYVL